MKVITRELYARKVDTWLGREQIIILVGQRRVGKSYVMKDFIARHSSEPDANIIYIDKEKRMFKYIKNSDDLEAYIDARLVDGDSEATRQREFGTLKMINDSYAKYVISATPLLRSADYDGIRHLHLRQFLRNGLE